MKRLIVLVVLVAVLAAGAWQWARPKSDVPLPGPDATPAETVTAFVEALNARDFDTSNAVLLHADDAWHQDRWSRAPHLEDLKIGDVTDATNVPGETLGERYDEAVAVDVSFVLYGGDGSMPDGPTTWGYTVARNGPDERWRIIDQGVG